MRICMSLTKWHFIYGSHIVNICFVVYTKALFIIWFEAPGNKKPNTTGY